jgi:sigma-B regulation protein RsbU (phosphoserine phosphatase)
MSPPVIPLLIVEDNPVFVEQIQYHLDNLPGDLRFETRWVDSAEKALAEIQQRRYDLLLLDYMLPGDNGLTVLTYIREKLPPENQPAVVMLTGIGREAVAVEAMKMGAKDYLPKDSLDPYDSAPLVRALNNALNQRRLEQALREKSAVLEADLQMAREIQQAFLPQAYPTFPSGVPPAESALQFHHCYESSVAVGGDFLDVFALSPTQAGVFICDVMGNGVRAALITAIVRALLEELRPLAGEPGRFLAEINRALMTILQRTRRPMFATAFYLVADVGAGRMRYASAGHPTPICVSQQTRRAGFLDFAGQPPGAALGVIEGAAYATYESPLHAGDLVVLFTDGLFEIWNERDEEYGLERLLAAVQQRADLPPAQLLAGLLDEVKRFSRQGTIHDDVCTLALQVVRTGGR